MTYSTLTEKLGVLRNEITTRQDNLYSLVQAMYLTQSNTYSYLTSTVHQLLLQISTDVTAIRTELENAEPGNADVVAAIASLTDLLYTGTHGGLIDSPMRFLNYSNGNVLGDLFDLLRFVLGTWATQGYDNDKLTNPYQDVIHYLNDLYHAVDGLETGLTEIKDAIGNGGGGGTTPGEYGGPLPDGVEVNVYPGTTLTPNYVVLSRWEHTSTGEIARASDLLIGAINFLTYSNSTWQETGPASDQAGIPTGNYIYYQIRLNDATSQNPQGSPLPTARCVIPFGGPRMWLYGTTSGEYRVNFGTANSLLFSGTILEAVDPNPDMGPTFFVVDRSNGYAGDIYLLVEFLPS